MPSQIAIGNCIIGISPLPTTVVALMACGGLATTQAMTKQKYHYNDNVSWPIDFQIHFQRITRSGLTHHGITYSAHIIKSFCKDYSIAKVQRLFYVSTKINKYYGL
jgi:uncharacterized OsmC-like protein